MAKNSNKKFHPSFRVIRHFNSPIGDLAGNETAQFPQPESSSHESCLSKPTSGRVLELLESLEARYTTAATDLEILDQRILNTIESYKPKPIVL